MVISEERAVLIVPKALYPSLCDWMQDSQSTGGWGRASELWRHCVAEIVLSSEELFALEEQVALRSLEGTKAILASLEETVWQLSGTGLKGGNSIQD